MADDARHKFDLENPELPKWVKKAGTEQSRRLSL